MKRRGALLHQTLAQHVECLCGGPFADARAVAAEGALDSVGGLPVGDGEVNQADWFFLGAARGAGDAGDADADGCAGAQADAVCEGLGHLSRDCAVLIDEFGGYAGEFVLEGVGVDDGSAEERARCAGDGGDALGDEAAGAAFGDSERGLAQAEVVEDDLLERFALRGVEPVFESFFESAGQLVDARLGGFDDVGLEQMRVIWMSPAWARMVVSTSV